MDIRLLLAQGSQQQRFLTAMSEKSTFNFQVVEIEASTCRSHSIETTNNKKSGKYPGCTRLIYKMLR
ncbi:hypothetical protein EUQ69_23240 [Salmonella enterica subsp. enterica serovar Newport]|jgi:hypothetical protein|nr:hypothetical protein [Salmonella enterica subsp. enterica serovar Newport]ECE7417745.1 hypothetical protein [Salmonella enterica subsp. enterica serovar Newport]MJS64412.1 hypothetical protein [Salmonella enterica subsp. enterica serovar Newport]